MFVEVFGHICALGHLGESVKKLHMGRFRRREHQEIDNHYADKSRSRNPSTLLILLNTGFWSHSSVILLKSCTIAARIKAVTQPPLRHQHSDRGLELVGKRHSIYGRQIAVCVLGNYLREHPKPFSASARLPDPLKSQDNNRRLLLSAR